MIPRLCTCFTALNLHELGNMGVGRVQSGQFKLQLGNMMSGPSKPPSWGGVSKARYLVLLPFRYLTVAPSAQANALLVKVPGVRVRRYDSPELQDLATFSLVRHASYGTYPEAPADAPNGQRMLFGELSQEHCEAEVS